MTLILLKENEIDKFEIFKNFYTKQLGLTVKLMKVKSKLLKTTLIMKIILKKVNFEKVYL